LPVFRVCANNYAKSSSVGVAEHRGCPMQQISEVVPERFVTCSESIELNCRCGEKLILLGRKADWRKEEHTVFRCSGCGRNLSLADSSRRMVLRRIEV
jgi:predicted SprT family Zn-dependent metalloprotease